MKTPEKSIQKKKSKKIKICRINVGEKILEISKIRNILRKIINVYHRKTVKKYLEVRKNTSKNKLKHLNLHLISSVKIIGFLTTET